MFSASQIHTSRVRGMKKRSKTKYKEGEVFDPTEEGTWRKCSRGRRSYSRLLSPFHLQLPLCFPEPSPGAQTPLSTSASSTSSSSRGIRPEDMLASEACTGATAQSRGPWGVLSHTLTYFAQLYGEIRNNNNTSSLLLGFPWSVSPGPRHQSPGGGGDCRHPASSWVIGIILVRSIALQAIIPALTDRQSTPGFLKSHSGILIVSFFSLCVLPLPPLQCLLELGTYLLQVLVKTSKLRSVVTAPMRRNGKRRSKLLPPLAEQKLFRSQCGPATLMVTHPWSTSSSSQLLSPAPGSDWMGECVLPLSLRPPTTRAVLIWKIRNKSQNSTTEQLWLCQQSVWERGREEERGGERV